MRAYNFNAGPSMLPEEVLRRARDELLNWHGSGLSVLEMSHRGRFFPKIAQQAEADLRELMAIPAEYRVLFLQGGATSQFAMVPMNLLRGKRKASYILTGEWSKKAAEEAAQFCQLHVAGTSEKDHYTSVPAPETWQIDPDSAYLHITTNETINGVEYQFTPDVEGMPLVADMSSNILSRPIDVSQYGLIYAGAQKNLGIAGITLVIVRDDLLGRVVPGTPTMYQYHQHVKQHSMLNTPPTFAWYMLGLMCDWLKRQGGIPAVAERNRHKAEKLYACLDGSGFYHNGIRKDCRSRMNVVFTMKKPELEEEFLETARTEGLIGLKGHRAVGGLRASLYNAMPEEGVDALITFLRNFEHLRG